MQSTSSPGKHPLLFVTIALLLLSFSAIAQTRISGIVSDRQTKLPLAFVSIGIRGTTIGTLSDIDGKYQLDIPAANMGSEIMFSYLGYESQVTTVAALQASGEVKLRSKNMLLGEVTVSPGINPADRIIETAVDNRDKNNPEKMRSFSYTSYNKMRVTSDIGNDYKAKTNAFDTTRNADTSLFSKTAAYFFSQQHLMISESVSERVFMRPDRNNEKVIASRVSGFKKSPFSMLATQLQSFAFYNDLITVLEKNYLNPVSPGSTKRYYFHIEDTLYSPQKDTVFVISYRPFRGKNFNALKGTLYINTNGYAIQNVLAESYERSGGVSIKIQQQYEFVENKQWFPSQLNTDWVYNNLNLNDGSEDTDTTSNPWEDKKKLKVVCRTYLSKIALNPEVSRRQFSEVEVEMDARASDRSEEFWNQYRTDSITQKDRRTYKTIDSLGKEFKFDRKLLFLEALLTGKLPIKFIDIDLNRILRFNDYEGFRLGVGFHTNNKLSEWFSIGGYGAYGFGDKTFKYGGDVSFLLWKKKEWRITPSYSNDVLESAGREFFENKNNLFSTEQVRNLYIHKMDRCIKYELATSFRAFHYLRTNIYANHQQRWGSSWFAMPARDGEPSVLKDTFQINEIGIQFRYALREKFMQTLYSKIPITGFNPYPVIYLNIGQGLQQEFFGQEGQLEYTRLDLKIDQDFRFRHIGQQHWQLQAGQVFGDVPYTLLYNNKGSFIQYTLSSMNSFETMKVNEFASSRYAALFFSHNFGRFLRKNELINPEIELVHNMGIGALEHPHSNYYVPIRTMEQGYFESGLRINHIISNKTSALGVGFFYRYGPYINEEVMDNLAIKFSYSLNL